MALELETKCLACAGKGHVTQEDIDRLDKDISTLMPLNDTMMTIFGSCIGDELRKKNEEAKKDSYTLLDVAKADLNTACTRCLGTGIVLTEDGKTLMTFLRKYIDRI
jgi:hypothetical protein